MKYADIIDTRLLIGWVDLSTKCNAACPQCHRTNPDGLVTADFLDEYVWTIEEFKRRFPVETLRMHKAFEFCGTWGDPLMNHDLLEICEYIIENSLASIHINTNGSLRSVDWWTELQVICKRRLTVVFALDGHDQETHELYRQKTNLTKVLENASAASIGATTWAFTIVFEHNQAFIPNIAEQAYKAGMSNMIIIPSNRFEGDNREARFRSKSYDVKRLAKTTLDDSHRIFGTWNLSPESIKEMRELMNG